MINHFLTLFMISTTYAADGGPVGGDNLDLSVQLNNPLTGIHSVPDLVIALLKIAISLGTWVAVFFIIYSGFLFIKARGNEKELETAKKTFLWTIIGTAILLGAYVIANAVSGTINQLGVPGAS